MMEKRFSGILWMLIIILGFTASKALAQTGEAGLAGNNAIISGLRQVCDYQEETYSVENLTGSTFKWEASGGDITTGQGTSELTIKWGQPGMGSLSIVVTNENGLTVLSEIIQVSIEDCSGKSGQALQKEIIIYPNPVNNTLHVRMNTMAGKQYQVTVFNHLGQNLYRFDFIGNGKVQIKQIETSEYTPGVYFVRIESGAKMLMNQKFIKN